MRVPSVCGVILLCMDSVTSLSVCLSDRCLSGRCLTTPVPVHLSAGQSAAVCHVLIVVGLCPNVVDVVFYRRLSTADRQHGGRHVVR